MSKSQKEPRNEHHWTLQDKLRLARTMIGQLPCTHHAMQTRLWRHSTCSQSYTAGIRDVTFRAKSRLREWERPPLVRSNKGPPLDEAGAGLYAWRRSSAWRRPLTVWRRTFSDEGPSVTKDLHWRRAFARNVRPRILYINSTPTFLYFPDLYFNTAYAAHYVYCNIAIFFHIYIYIYTYAIGVHFICQYWNLMLFGN